MKTNTPQQDLHRVIDSCRDSAAIFMAAAERAEASDLQNTFLLFALQRRNFIELLFRESQKEGIRLRKQTTVFNLFQKYLNTLMVAFSSGNDSRILNTCRNCESVLIGLYDRVLENREMPESLRTILHEHQQLIRSSADRYLVVSRTA